MRLADKRVEIELLEMEKSYVCVVGRAQKATNCTARQPVAKQHSIFWYERQACVENFEAAPHPFPLGPQKIVLPFTSSILKRPVTLVFGEQKKTQTTNHTMERNLNCKAYIM
jgi:hypothetical protein